MWLNPDRAGLFFARHVLVCEGQADKAVLDYLIDQAWPELISHHVHIVDALGKFCIHRYMALLDAFGIAHSVLMDRDSDEGIHRIANDFIEGHRMPSTKAIFAFPTNMEGFLGVEGPPRGDLKAVHLVSCLRRGEVTGARLQELRGIIDGLLALNTRENPAVAPAAGASG